MGIWGLSYPTQMRLILINILRAARLAARPQPALATLALASLVPACAAQPQETGLEGRVERRLGLMGTSLELEVEAADRAAALLASEAAVRALEATEDRLSTWRPDSELARLNAAPIGQLFPASPALRADLEAALGWSQATGGAFQPAVAPLVRSWDLRQGGRFPTPAELEQALAASRPGAFRLTEDGVLRARAEAGLEEGGFGKGRGLDLALAALRASGARRARLDLGGQLAFLGAPAAPVPVAHPQQRDQVAVLLELDGGSLATSGNSERGLVVDGRRIGHLLDPRSGRPAADFGSLSVWAPDATAADCLSTGLYALGPEAALAWAERHPGIEVLILDTRKPGGLRIHVTRGLEGRIKTSQP